MNLRGKTVQKHYFVLLTLLVCCYAIGWLEPIRNTKLAKIILWIHISGVGFLLLFMIYSLSHMIVVGKDGFRLYKLIGQNGLSEIQSEAIHTYFYTIQKLKPGFEKLSELEEQHTTEVIVNKLFRASLARVFIPSYLMVIISLAFAYQQIDVLAPGAIAYTNGELVDGFGDFLYFSIISLTTVGYGDITPISGFARFLASAEALCGILMAVISIGFIVNAQNHLRLIIDYAYKRTITLFENNDAEGQTEVHEIVKKCKEAEGDHSDECLALRNILDKVAIYKNEVPSPKKDSSKTDTGTT